MAVKPLNLVVDATLDPLKERMKEAKAVLGELGLSVGETVDKINAAFRNTGDPAGTGQIKQMQAALSQYVRQAEDAAKVKIAAFDTSSVAGMRAAADALEQLALEQQQLAQSAKTAAFATKEEEAAFKVMAGGAAFAGSKLLEQSEQVRLNALVMEKMGVSARASADAVVEGHTKMGASGAILQHVIRSTTDSFAAGLPPSMIFAEQIGRIGEAAALSGGALGAAGEVLAGPWGIAIIGGISLLTTLIGHLADSTSEAEKNASEFQKLAAVDDGVGAAQAALGEMFDLVTGKLEHQNGMIRANIALMVAKMRADADAADAKARTGALEASTESWGHMVGRVADNPAALLTGRAPQSGHVAPFAELQIDRILKSDPKKVGDALFGALNWAAGNKDKFEGTQTTYAKFLGVARDAANSVMLKATADKSEQSAKSGVLDASFINPQSGGGRTRNPRGRAGGADTSVQDNNKVATALDQAEIERLRIAREGVTDAQQLAALDKQAVDIALRKQLTGNQLLKADHTALDAAEIANATAKKGVIDAKLLREMRDKELQNAADGRAAQIQMLQAQFELTTTTKARKTIALQVLDLERQQAIAAIDKDRLDGRLSFKQALTKTDQTNTLFDEKGAILEHQNQGPLAAYREQLHRNTDDINEALDGVKARGLQGLEDGLVGLISGTESVASAFKKMAASILADLARIAIEKAIVSLLGFQTGNVPGHAAGHIPGFASGVISGPGTGTSDSILAAHQSLGLIRVSNGESIITARGTAKHRNLLRAINDDSLPAFAGGYLPSYPAIPTTASLRSGPMVLAPIQFDLRGAVMTQDLLVQMQRISAAHAQAAVLGGASLAHSQVTEDNERRLY